METFSLIRSEKLKVMKKKQQQQPKTKQRVIRQERLKINLEKQENHIYHFVFVLCLLLGNICHLTSKQRACVLLGSLMINLDVENRGLSQEIIVFELLEYVRLFQNLNRLRIYLLRFCGHSFFKGNVLSK